jgi:hypothetical protein
MTLTVHQEVRHDGAKVMVLLSLHSNMLGCSVQHRVSVLSQRQKRCGQGEEATIMMALALASTMTVVCRAAAGI